MTKPVALRRAKVAQESLNKAEHLATTKAVVRDARVAEAQGAGATYAEIREATGLSMTRLTQILRRARNR